MGGPTVRPHLGVPMHGATVEVSHAALESELVRRGQVASLALVEAIIRHAPRDAAIERLIGGLVDGQQGTVLLTTLLGLVRLEATSAARDLATSQLGPPLDVTARIVTHVVAGTFGELAAEIARDDLVAQRAPLVLTALPRSRPDAAIVFHALIAAVGRLQPSLGVTAYRAFLGDVAEAAFRQLQHGAAADALLGPARSALVDQLAAELPGTPDLVAARGMAWLLGTLAPSDDAARSAIERASARFRDPVFHRDCALMLDDGPGRAWPPA